MNQRVLECIYAAIDEANLEGLDPPMGKAPETPVHGNGSNLDSLGLINFVVAVEENVEQAFGVSIVLGDERALDLQPSPFDSVAALADYVETLLGESG